MDLLNIYMIVIVVRVDSSLPVFSLACVKREEEGESEIYLTVVCVLCFPPNNTIDDTHDKIHTDHLITRRKFRTSLT